MNGSDSSSERMLPSSGIVGRSSDVLPAGRLATQQQPERPDLSQGILFYQAVAADVEVRGRHCPPGSRWSERAGHSARRPC